jgi:hypothetical protein
MDYNAMPCDCGGSRVPVLYGYPTTHMIELAKAGMIALGGCLVDRSIDGYCYSCNKTFENNTFKEEK